MPRPYDELDATRVLQFPAFAKTGQMSSLGLQTRSAMAPGYKRMPVTKSTGRCLTEEQDVVGYSMVL